jgi:hypothetical protein
VSVPFSGDLLRHYEATGQRTSMRPARQSAQHRLPSKSWSAKVI